MEEPEWAKERMERWVGDSENTYWVVNFDGPFPYWAYAGEKLCTKYVIYFNVATLRLYVLSYITGKSYAVSSVDKRLSALDGVDIFYATIPQELAAVVKQKIAALSLLHSL
jgi:hypothetical protein